MAELLVVDVLEGVRDEVDMVVTQVLMVVMILVKEVTESLTSGGSMHGLRMKEISMKWALVQLKS
jgi:hypothetical protein